jgi:NAD(P)-dependent dehydrogenase (short-subunit alcohol dehydrogenase family)
MVTEIGATLGMFDLHGKVALVTGGSSGIGLAMATALVDAGAEVCIWGRTPEKNKAAASQLTERGARVIAHQVDIGDEAQVVEAMGTLVDQLGHLDACFANASAHTPSRARFVDSSLDDWRAVTRVVLDGTYLTLREAAKVMVDQNNGGSLIATSSAAAHFGVPRAQAYAASKAGVVSMMRGLAVELARHRIRANTILPAWVMSSFMDGIADDAERTKRVQSRIPLRRWAQPDELGGIAVYLASDASSWHTGDEFRLDGGYTIS